MSIPFSKMLFLIIKFCYITELCINIRKLHPTIFAVLLTVKKSICFFILSFWYKSSWLSHEKYWPLIFFIPRFSAEETPPFSFLKYFILFPKERAILSVSPSSTEPSFITITSIFCMIDLVRFLSLPLENQNRYRQV